MFGYVIPDKPNMYIKDFNLYRAYYCGLCKSIGKKYGNILRLSTNYDMTFLAIFADAVLGGEPIIKKETCILNPVTKRPIVKENKVLDRVTDINILFIHYKLQDDIYDENKLSKKIADKVLLRRAYKKARKKEKEIDQLLDSGFKKLNVLESSKEKSIDKVSDVFATILAQVSGLVLGDKKSEYTYDIFYELGKIVYLIDAIDDIEDDFKNKEYNVFLEDYDFKDKKTFLEEQKEKLEFILINCYVSIKKSLENIELGFSEGVIVNILWYGIPFIIRNTLAGDDTWKKIRI